VAVPEFRAREDLIRQLENCVQERNEVIDKLETNLKVAEMALTSAVYQLSTNNCQQAGFNSGELHAFHSIWSKACFPLIASTSITSHF
ncbi:unnamed protein product, partial [Strongylus vulgaris]